MSLYIYSNTETDTHIYIFLHTHNKHMYKKIYTHLTDFSEERLNDSLAIGVTDCNTILFILFSVKVLCHFNGYA